MYTRVSCVLFASVLAICPATRSMEEVTDRGADAKRFVGWTADRVLDARVAAGSALALLTAGYAAEKEASVLPLVLGACGFALVCYGTSVTPEDSRNIRVLKKSAWIAGSLCLVAGLVLYARTMEETDTAPQIVLKSAALCLGFAGLEVIKTALGIPPS